MPPYLLLILLPGALSTYLQWIKELHHLKEYEGPPVGLVCDLGPVACSLAGQEVYGFRPEHFSLFPAAEEPARSLLEVCGPDMGLALCVQRLDQQDMPTNRPSTLLTSPKPTTQSPNGPTTQPPIPPVQPPTSPTNQTPTNHAIQPTSFPDPFFPAPTSLHPASQPIVNIVGPRPIYISLLGGGQGAQEVAHLQGQEVASLQGQEVANLEGQEVASLQGQEVRQLLVQVRQLLEKILQSGEQGYM